MTDSFQGLARTCENIAGTTKKLQKTAMVSDFLKSLSPEVAAVAAVFLSGRPFPVWEESTLQIGGRSLWQLVADLSGKNEGELDASYRKYGDLGGVAQEVLPQRDTPELDVLDVEQAFRKVAAARGPSAKAALVRDLLARATPLEAKYIVKIMTGDLRIGLKESLVEEAIAKAYCSPLAEVQRANMLLGDIGETLKLAFEHQLSHAKIRLFHPIGFMLASPIESAEEGLTYFADAAVEDKYDGIRAQAHVSQGEVRIFSRTRDDITEWFPELPPALSSLPEDVILDGEIVAWEYPARLEATKAIVDETSSQVAEEKATNMGRARPFAALQPRLGRKKVSDKMLQETAVAYLVFDVLYSGGELTIDQPLRERAHILDALLNAPRKARSSISRTAKTAGQQSLVFGENEFKEGFSGKQHHAGARVPRVPIRRVGTAVYRIPSKGQRRPDDQRPRVHLQSRKTRKVVAQNET